MGLCVSNEKLSSIQLLRTALATVGESAPIIDGIQKYYRFKDVIGSGSMGTVRSAVCKRTDTNTPPVAVRSVLKASVQSNLEVFRQELALFRILDHPNIARYYEMFEDQKYFHVVMELCTGGSLADRLVERGPLRESEVRAIFAKLISAVNHIHQNRLCHRDLRPENILYLSSESGSDFKIVDFCDMTFISMAGSSAALGRCQSFMAPELVDGQVGAFGKECDIWSLGGILYYLLSGSLPFDDSDQAAQLYHIMASDLSFSAPAWDVVSKSVQNLIRRMMHVKPRLRMQLSEVLRHEWMTSGHEGSPLPPNVLRSLMSFKSPKRLQREVMRAVVKFASPDSLSQLNVTGTQAAFSALDKEKSGVLSVDQLKQALLRSGLSNPEVESDCHTELLQGIANPENQTVNYSDFLVAATNHQRLLCENTLFLAFKRFDLVLSTQDDDGFITYGEMQNGLKNLGSTVSEEEIRDMMRQYAHDTENLISYNEFKEMMKDVDARRGSLLISAQCGLGNC